MSPQIFVSSAHLGLEGLRDLVETVATSVRLRGIDEARVVRTETGGAAPAPPLEECLRRVRTSDLVVLIVGYRYGTPVAGDAAGRSYTEVEFDEAIAAEKPLFVFLANDRTMFKRKEIDPLPQRINKFRLRIESLQEKHGYMINYFGNTAEFQAAIERSFDSHLRRIAERIVVNVDPAAQLVRLPTRLRPPYDGIQDQKLYGRDAELEELDRWYRAPDQSALMIRAIGGMGKSSLAWRWFEQLDERCPDIAHSGKFWFSFYHVGHTIRRFLQEMRGWLEDSVPSGARFGNEHDWPAIQRYLSRMKLKPLIILDGLEAEFFGYVGRRPHFDDTPNLGAEFGNASAAKAPDSEEEMLDKFADFRDENHGRILVDLIGSGLAKILITTREIPTSFVKGSIAGQVLIGGLHQIKLEELSPISAKSLLVDLGIRAESATLDLISKSRIMRHPLLLSVFSRRVLNDDLAKGDLDAFIEKYPSVKLWAFAKHGDGSGRHHVLQFAFNNLSEIEEYIIELITVTDVPLLSDFVVGTAEKVRGYAAEAISAALDNLKYRRGIINAARRKAENGKEEVFYSMHPVCRMYANRMTIRDFRKSAESIDVEFEKYLFGGVGRGITTPTVFDVESRILPVVRVTLAAGKDERAWQFLDAVRGCYQQFGLYGTYYQIISEFLAFSQGRDGLRVRSQLTSRQEASKLLFDGAELNRLFGESEKSIACARALVDLASRSEGDEPGSAAEAAILTRERADWLLLVSRFSTQDAEENVRSISNFISNLHNRTETDDGDITLSEALGLISRSNIIDIDDDIHELNEFLISQSYLNYSYTTLAWNICTSLSRSSNFRTSRCNAFSLLELLFSSADPRNFRFVILKIISGLWRSKDLVLARSIYDRISALEGWEQLDLYQELELCRLYLLLLEAEAEGAINEKEYQKIDSSLATYELHYQSRLSRYGKLDLTLFRLRLQVLAERPSHITLNTAVELCLSLKLPRSGRAAQELLRCAEKLERKGEVERVLRSLPLSYQITGLLPDPIFGFNPRRARSGPRPWGDA